jgi:hypothetical protein
MVGGAEACGRSGSSSRRSRTLRKGELEAFAGSLPKAEAEEIEKRAARLAAA